MKAYFVVARTKPLKLSGFSLMKYQFVSDTINWLNSFNTRKKKKTSVTLENSKKTKYSTDDQKQWNGFQWAQKNFNYCQFVSWNISCLLKNCRAEIKGTTTKRLSDWKLGVDRDLAYQKSIRLSWWIGFSPLSPHSV